MAIRERHQEPTGVQATEHLEVNFFLCGAQKAGTTFFHKLFSKIPYISMTSKKELKSFNFHYAKEKTGTTPTSEERANGIAGDVSPHYMVNGAVIAPRILEYNPDATLIFSLRDPVQRVWSHYWLNIRKGYERMGFLDAIEAEQQPSDGNRRIEEFLDLPGNARLDDDLWRRPVKEGGIGLARPAQRWLYRNKALFRRTRTLGLWSRISVVNLALGKPNPKITKEAADYVTPLWEDDRRDLLELLKMEGDPWS